MEDKFAPIRKGLLELVVLKIISSKKVYAADILAQLNTTQFVAQEGTLYPLLSRLRREGSVQYEWIESKSGPPRKYYSLTQKGTSQLKTLVDYWQDLHSTINKI